MKNTLYCLLFSVLMFSNCGKDSTTVDEQIEAYLAGDSRTAEVTDEGIHYIIENEGTGTRPSIVSTVKVHYEGRYTDGEKFDSSYDRGAPSEFGLGQVIPGWGIGIPLFREGGKGTLIIPPNYGYGANPQNGIRKNAVLVFDIELLEVL